jgi:hypothetical protein
MLIPEARCSMNDGPLGNHRITPQERTMSASNPSQALVKARRAPRGVAALAATAAAALLLAGCGGGGDGGGNGGTAQALSTVGPNLAQIVPDNGIRCVDGYPVQNPGGGGVAFFVSQGSGSCLVMAPLEHNPGRPGIAVAATIKVGAVTGRMRFVRMRNAISGVVNDAACCSLEEYGQVFTPAANSTTTVPLNFRLEWEAISAPNPTRSVVQEFVALEILDPFVPWPGFWPNGGNADTLRFNQIFIPALSAQNLAAPTQNFRGGTFSGFVPSFSFTFAPAI